MKRPKHPFVQWIEALPHKLTIYKFAVQSGFNQRTLYTMIDRDRPKLPLIDTLRRLEVETHGAVTIESCLDWFYSRKRRAAE